MLIIMHFQTCILTGWSHRQQPIKSHLKSHDSLTLLHRHISYFQEYDINVRKTWICTVHYVQIQDWCFLKRITLLCIQRLTNPLWFELVLDSIQSMDKINSVLYILHCVVYNCVMHNFAVQYELVVYIYRNVFWVFLVWSDCSTFKR